MYTADADNTKRKSTFFLHSFSSLRPFSSPIKRGRLTNFFYSFFFLSVRFFSSRRTVSHPFSSSSFLTSDDWQAARQRMTTKLSRTSSSISFFFRCFCDFFAWSLRRTKIFHFPPSSLCLLDAAFLREAISFEERRSKDKEKSKFVSR